MATRRVIVLGSTGSIGVQTIEVIEHLNALHARAEFPRRHEVVGLAAGNRRALLAEQASRLGVHQLAIAGGTGGEPTPLRSSPAAGEPVAARHGPDAAERLVREVPCDLVVSAIAGTAGLGATWAAVQLGRDVALANKESLVAAGALIVPEALRTGSRLLPIDSEHAGLWQCLAGLKPEARDEAHEQAADPPRPTPPLRAPDSVARVWITASGGALRGRSGAEAYHATPEEALRHPTWSMGPKVTIDSATLMNKALELIEAHWLFGLPPERIGVLIHPQSIVHALVETTDGGAIAQLGVPDMRGPIQHAFTHPTTRAGLARRLDWAQIARLEFRMLHDEAARAVDLARGAIVSGGTAGAILNAANEAAVHAFLARRIPFGRIVELTAAAMHEMPATPLHDPADAIDAAARARGFVARHAGG